MDDNKDEKKKLTDVFKKVIGTGVSAAFMTEDAIKGIINELPLPKELAQGLLSNAKNSKNEFINGVKNELKGYLDKIDLSKEIDRVLEKYDVEVNAKLSFKKKEKDSE
ncbi:MAG: hypothetical protein N4A33_02075 [Bacteriovoracaceae bacterium]|jgi:hypothetical protein|nr:hypothetical protein [Bacteriovoracaceae bacterium]